MYVVSQLSVLLVSFTFSSLDIKVAEYASFILILHADQRCSVLIKRLTESDGTCETAGICCLDNMKTTAKVM